MTRVGGSLSRGGGAVPRCPGLRGSRSRAGTVPGSDRSGVYLIAAPADLVVGAAPRKESAGRRSLQHASHPADDDSVGMSLDPFVDFAVENRDRVRKVRNAVWQGAPVSFLVTILLVQVGTVGEALGELPMVSSENIDRKGAEPLERRICRRRVADADHERRRLCRQRGDRGRCEPVSLFAYAERHDANPARELPHRRLKGLSVRLGEREVGEAGSERMDIGRGHRQLQFGERQSYII